MSKEISLTRVNFILAALAPQLKLRVDTVGTDGVGSCGCPYALLRKRALGQMISAPSNTITGEMRSDSRRYSFRTGHQDLLGVCYHRSTP